MRMLVFRVNLLHARTHNGKQQNNNSHNNKEYWVKITIWPNENRSSVYGVQCLLNARDRKNEQNKKAQRGKKQITVACLLFFIIFAHMHTYASYTNVFLNFKWTHFILLVLYNVHSNRHVLDLDSLTLSSLPETIRPEKICSNANIWLFQCIWSRIFGLFWDSMLSVCVYLFSSAHIYFYFCCLIFISCLFPLIKWNLPVPNKRNEIKQRAKRSASD